MRHLRKTLTNISIGPLDSRRIINHPTWNRPAPNKVQSSENSHWFSMCVDPQAEFFVGYEDSNLHYQSDQSDNTESVDCPGVLVKLEKLMRQLTSMHSGQYFRILSDVQWFSIVLHSCLSIQTNWLWDSVPPKLVARRRKKKDIGDTISTWLSPLALVHQDFQRPAQTTLILKRLLEENTTEIFLNWRTNCD